MKVSNMIGERFKDRPSDCVSDNHALLVKGGYIKQVSNGVYSLNPIMARILKRIECIANNELNKVGAQEVSLTAITPIELIKESKRLDGGFIKFTDYDNIEMAYVDGSHELAIQLVRDSAKSYTNYPFIIYQNKKSFVKGRKASGGLVNLKESEYNQVYSFHTSLDDLNEKYQLISEAYTNILSKCGLSESVKVENDKSHKFALLTDIGEEKFVKCDACDYCSSFDNAVSNVKNEEGGNREELKLVVTPGVTTIAALAEFLNVDVKRLCKSVAYQRESDGSIVVGFIRGDLDVNESKLMRLAGDDLYPAELTEDSLLSGGFIGPYKIPKEVDVFFDKSLSGIESLAIGANEFDKHYTGFNIERDYGEVEFVDLADVNDGDICSHCGEKSIVVKKGVTLGEISKTGDTFTKAMDMNFLDVEGSAKTPLMGVYSLDLLRVAALVCENSHDDYGPMWPMTIAPWKVQVCCLRCDDEACRTYADELYDKLTNSGIEVLYDDRKVRPGSMFSDADLFGCPLRVVVSPRNMKESCVEISSRDKSYQHKPSLEEAFDEILKFLGK